MADTTSVLNSENRPDKNHRRRWIWWGGGLLGIAALGFFLFFIFSGTVREAVELALEGGEKVLREPMRPIRGETRVLLIALDGVGDQTLREMIRQGRMLQLAAILGSESDDGVYAHAYAVPDAMSILPSTTMAAWASVYTGKPVAETGISGNEWFAREEQRFYAPAPISVPEHEHTLKMYSEGLIGQALPVPTLYERLDLRSHVSLAPVFRGADLLTAPDLREVAELFGALARGLVNGSKVERENYAALDEGSVDKILETFEKHGVPDLQVAYFPGIDLFTHLVEEPIEQLGLYLEEVIDPILGRLFQAYSARGLLEDTCIVITADHGHTPVLKDEHHALGSGKEGEPPELLQKLGFRTRAAELEVGDRKNDYQAVLAYQGAIAYIYLADRSGCPRPGDRCPWNSPPRLEEDVLPVARAFYKANLSGELVPELKGTLDLIFTREPRPVHEPALPFQIFDGTNLIPIGEFLEKNPRPDLVRLDQRMHELSAGPYGHRAGDILLLAKSGLSRPVEERYYFSGLYHSWHGSPDLQDSHIPLLIARHGSSGAELRQKVATVVGNQPSQLHVAPIIELLLGK